MKWECPILSVHVRRRGSAFASQVELTLAAGGMGHEALSVQLAALLAITTASAFGLWFTSPVLGLD